MDVNMWARTCATRIARETCPREEVILQPALDKPQDDHGPETRLGPSTPRIDKVKDLIILEPNWTHRLECGRVNTNAVHTMTYLAIAQTISYSMRGVIKKLMDGFEPKIFYIILSPDQVRAAAEKPWPTSGFLTLPATLTSGPLRLRMSDFLAAYDCGAPDPGPFKGEGGREYYEIPLGDVRRLGGLIQSAAPLAAVRRRRLVRQDNTIVSEDTVAYRFMTWRESGNINLL